MVSATPTTIVDVSGSSRIKIEAIAVMAGTR